MELQEALGTSAAQGGPLCLERIPAGIRSIPKTDRTRPAAGSTTAHLPAAETHGTCGTSGLLSHADGSLLPASTASESLRIVDHADKPDTAAEIDPATQRLLKEIPRRNRILQSMQLPLAVPSGPATQPWMAYAVARNEAYANELLHKGTSAPATDKLAAVFQAYAQDDAKPSTRPSAITSGCWPTKSPAELDLRLVRFEAYFNHVAPFFHLVPLYFLALVLTAFGWLSAVLSPRLSMLMRSAAFWLIVMAFVLHTFALVARVVISGPPACDQSLLFRRVHRLGMRCHRAADGDHLPAGNRCFCLLGGRNRYADHRASSCGGWRHDSRTAGGSRYAVLVDRARPYDHARLFCRVPGGAVGTGLADLHAGQDGRVLGSCPAWVPGRAPDAGQWAVGRISVRTRSGSWTA